MAKKPTRADLEAEIARLRPYELIHELKHHQDMNPDAPPVYGFGKFEYSGGRFQVTVKYYGHWLVATGGVIEVVAQPIDDNGNPTSTPIVEVHSYDYASTAVAAFTRDEPTYRPPWRSLIRWVITDGVRLANQAQDLRNQRAAVAARREGTLPPAGSAKLRYRIHQILPEVEGGPWVSEVFDGDTRHAAQNVIAGWLAGQPRWAVEEGTYRFLYGLDGKGKEIREAPAMVGTATPERIDEGSSPAGEVVS